MKIDLSDPYWSRFFYWPSKLINKIFRGKFNKTFLLLSFAALIFGVFFLSNIAISNSNLLEKYTDNISSGHEVFGFAPFWTFSKMDNIDWDVLTTFAYFSLPVNADGSISKNTHEWRVFEGKQLGELFDKAQRKNVRKVVTITMMDGWEIETFLSTPSAWERVARESSEILKNRDLDGVNIDFEYIPRNDTLKRQFSAFVDLYVGFLNKNNDDPYVTVSVLASSARFDKIYDIGHLATATDGVFMMAYDFYYPGSEMIGPSAPLYGYSEGDGPFWYDVSTAVDDFLKVAPSDKIIMGVPYYGWNYPAAVTAPMTQRNRGKAFATTLEKAQEDRLITTTPIGGWDDTAKVSWRGYWDEDGWHIVYLEDTKSLSYKYDFARGRGLAGVGIWALGYDDGDDNLWATLRDEFENVYLSSNKTASWNLF